MVSHLGPSLPTVPEYVQSLIQEAIHARASDIHFEPFEKQFRVRLRIDGQLHLFKSLPIQIHPSITTHLKLASNMNIAEKRLPQDGRIAWMHPTKNIDIRLSSIPTIYGESLVLRILDTSHLSLNLNQLGFMEDHLELVQSLIHIPDGMILVTGPTGSGKTTTLYSILSTLNTPSKKIITIEDPIEYQIPNIHQVPVNVNTGLTFGHALKSILRHNPNIIMIGEIRDKETANIAANAAITGHKVFSTLHTHNTLSAIMRLIEMDVQPFIIAAGLKGIIAQRLVRKRCQYCDPNALETCTYCLATGYYQRLGIFEVLKINSLIEQVIVQNCQRSNLQKIFQDLKIRTLIEDGLLKEKLNLTTRQEVLAWSMALLDT